MAAPKKTPLPAILLANDLLDGDVVFGAPTGWTRDPRGALVAQVEKDSPASKAGLQPGDLVFFNTMHRAFSHVGIYIGNGMFIHASSSKKKVVTRSLATYSEKYLGARRVIK